ncbi:hypothetical protein [Mucilaginibacter sp. CSA2-8R]
MSFAVYRWCYHHTNRGQVLITHQIAWRMVGGHPNHTLKYQIRING